MQLVFKIKLLCTCKLAWKYFKNLFHQVRDIKTRHTKRLVKVGHDIIKSFVLNKISAMQSFYDEIKNLGTKICVR